MPLSRKPIEGRRCADQQVSKEFGGRGAAVHSPSKERPGKTGRALHEAFVAQGFTVATTLPDACADPRLIEVFPLAALVSLMQIMQSSVALATRSPRRRPIGAANL